MLAAMEDGLEMPSITSKLKVLLQIAVSHTLLEMELNQPALQNALTHNHSPSINAQETQSFT